MDYGCLAMQLTHTYLFEITYFVRCLDCEPDVSDVPLTESVTRAFPNIFFYTLRN